MFGFLFRNKVVVLDYMKEGVYPYRKSNGNFHVLGETYAEGNVGIGIAVLLNNDRTGYTEYKIENMYSSGSDLLYGPYAYTITKIKDISIEKHAKKYNKLLTARH